MECAKHDLERVKRPGELWLSNKRGKCSLVFRYTYEINGPIIGKLTFFVPHRGKIYQDSFWLGAGTFLLEADQIKSPVSKLHQIYNDLLLQDNLMAEDLACEVLENYFLKLSHFKTQENERLLY